MSRILLLFITTLIISSCSSVKRSQKALYSGDYNEAIYIAIKKLQKDKTKSKNEPHILILEEAFKKAVSEEKRRVKFLNKENNPNSYREVYDIYINLARRQNSIRPLLPLYSKELGRNASFKFDDFSKEIVQATKNLSEVLYEEANVLMQSNNKLDYRDAYYILEELDDVNPGYRDIWNLKKEAHDLGTDYIYVTLNNRSFQILPIRLERELLDFNTYGLDDMWNEYHTTREQGFVYDYGITLDIRRIDISPEKIVERQFDYEKRVKDGWHYKKDRNGNYILDNDGNKIKVDDYIKVKATLFEFEQTKAVFVGADVIYKNLKTRKIIDRHPLSVEFIFENIYGEVDGDKRALNDEDIDSLNFQFLPFPSDSKMVFDAGEELKIQLKEILKDNSFR